jgi:hypothetical protein
MYLTPCFQAPTSITTEVIGAILHPSYLAFSLLQKYINGYMDSTKIEFSEKYRLDFSHFKALVNLYCLRAERADSTRTRIEMLQKVCSLFELYFSPQQSDASPQILGPICFITHFCLINWGLGVPLTGEYKQIFHCCFLVRVVRAVEIQVLILHHRFCKLSDMLLCESVTLTMHLDDFLLPGDENALSSVLFS